MIKKSDIKGEIPTNKQIYKNTFDIAWPSALESVFIALIAAVDTAMVGTVGKEAISAVGITSQPKFIVMAPIFALNIGVTVLVARRKGEGKQDEANAYLRNAIVVSTILAASFSLLAGIFAEPFLRFAGANSDYINHAVNYFRIILVGNFFYSTGLTLTAAQRGVGNTKISMVTNMAANIVNVVFNALLINGLFFFPKLGVEGAAIATFIGNFVSFVIAVYSVTKEKSYLYLDFKESFKPQEKYLLDIWNISKNTFTEQIFMRIGFFTYSKSVASLGTTSYAAHQVCMNVLQMSFACGDGLQIANTSLVGQSLGKNRSDMAKIYTKVAQRIGMIVAICISVTCFVFSDQIARIFTSDPEVLAATKEPLDLLVITVLFQIPQVITIGALRGAGDVRFVAGIMLLSVLIIRPLLSYILCYPLNFGLPGAWIALLLDQITRNVVSRLRFKKGNWEKIHV